MHRIATDKSFTTSRISRVIFWMPIGPSPVDTIMTETQEKLQRLLVILLANLHVQISNQVLFLGFT